MADKIADILSKIAQDVMDNIDDHLKLRKKNNLGQIATLDQQSRIQTNLKQCFELIKRSDDYYQFMHLRTLREQERNAAEKKPTMKQEIEEEESETDDQPDEEELEAIRKQSMAGLFMGFSIKKNDEPKAKKAPPLPPRDDISEDSMEDMVSDFDAGGDEPE